MIADNNLPQTDATGKVLVTHASTPSDTTAPIIVAADNTPRPVKLNRAMRRKMAKLARRK